MSLLLAGLVCAFDRAALTGKLHKTQALIKDWKSQMEAGGFSGPTAALQSALPQHPSWNVFLLTRMIKYEDGQLLMLVLKDES